MTELKPCPFCGGDAKMICISSVSDTANGISKIFQIVCGHCDTKQDAFKISAIIRNDGTYEFDNTEEVEAIEKWNRRVSENDKTI